MLAAAFNRGGIREEVCLSETFGWFDCHEFGLALCERACFVDDNCIDFFQRLERFSILDQNARLSALSGRDHDRHWRRKTQRAGTCDDEHSDRINDCECHGRMWPENRPDDESDNSGQNNHRNKQARHSVGELLDRCTRALGFGDHAHNLRQHRIRSNAGRRHDKRTRAIHGAAGDRIACCFLHWNGFARDHGLVDIRPALSNLAIDRDFLAGANAQTVAGLNVINRDFLVLAIRHDPIGRWRREFQKRTDRA